MIETTNLLSVTKSLRLLSDGFKNDFVEHCHSSEQMTELLMELSTEFVDANIPINDDDLRVELALMLMESVSFVAQ